jgi:hypothetical protein
LDLYAGFPVIGPLIEPENKSFFFLSEDVIGPVIIFLYVTPHLIFDSYI